jgi:hypothetical protein
VENAGAKLLDETQGAALARTRLAMPAIGCAGARRQSPGGSGALTGVRRKPSGSSNFIGCIIAQALPVSCRDLKPSGAVYKSLIVKLSANWPNIELLCSTT